eukprot:8074792-Karenia_brevis.AAC.1
MPEEQAVGQRVGAMTPNVIHFSMQKESSMARCFDALTPSVISFNAAISACAESNQRDMALVQ